MATGSQPQDSLIAQAIQTLETMLMDRGHKIVARSVDLSEPYQIKSTNGDNNHVHLSFVCTDDKLSIQGIKDKLSVMSRERATAAIIVYKLSATPSAKKSLEIIDTPIELFGLHELQLNVTRHRLVPKHERATREEKQTLDGHYKGKLPTILTTDPVSRYYGFKKGEYIRITRKNGEVVYRQVR